jgi:hypothetical protein
LSAFITANGVVTFGYYFFYEGKGFNQIPAKTALLGFLTFELDTNYEIDQRKNLVEFEKRIQNREARIDTYKSKLSMKLFEQAVNVILAKEAHNSDANNNNLESFQSYASRRILLLYMLKAQDLLLKAYFLLF